MTCLNTRCLNVMRPDGALHLWLQVHPAVKQVLTWSSKPPGPQHKAAHMSSIPHSSGGGCSAVQTTAAMMMDVQDPGTIRRYHSRIHKLEGLQVVAGCQQANPPGTLPMQLQQQWPACACSRHARTGMHWHTQPCALAMRPEIDIS